MRKLRPRAGAGSSLRDTRHARMECRPLLLEREMLQRESSWQEPKPGGPFRATWRPISGCEENNGLDSGGRGVEPAGSTSTPAELRQSYGAACVRASVASRCCLLRYKDVVRKRLPFAALCGGVATQTDGLLPRVRRSHSHKRSERPEAGRGAWPAGFGHERGWGRDIARRLVRSPSRIRLETTHFRPETSSFWPPTSNFRPSTTSSAESETSSAESATSRPESFSSSPESASSRAKVGSLRPESVSSRPESASSLDPKVGPPGLEAPVFSGVLGKRAQSVPDPLAFFPASGAGAGGAGGAGSAARLRDSVRPSWICSRMS